MINDDDLLIEDTYNKYKDTLRTFADTLLVPLDEIDDIIQETFLEFFQKYYSICPEYYIKGMLFKILRGKSIDYFRKNGQIQQLNIDDESTIRRLLYLSGYMTTDPADIILNHELFQKIALDITNMRKPWRDIAIMYFLEQRTIPEICTALNISKTVCYSRLYRSRIYLKMVISEYAK